MQFDEKYRPRALNDVVGNYPVISSLKSLFEKDIKEFPRAIMFSGNTGLGKTTLARIVANDLAEKYKLEVIEVNSSKDRGVDFVRSLIDSNEYTAFGTTGKIIILDEAHQLTPAAQSAFLNELEDVNSLNYYILTTTDPLELKQTVRDRTRHYQLQPVAEGYLYNHVCNIALKEEIPLTKGVAEGIVKHSGGSMRNAVSFIEKVQGLSHESALEMLSLNTCDAERLAEMDMAVLIFEACKKHIKDTAKQAQLMQKILSEIREKNLNNANIIRCLYNLMGASLVKSAKHANWVSSCVLFLKEHLNDNQNATLSAVLYRLIALQEGKIN